MKPYRYLSLAPLLGYLLLLGFLATSCATSRERRRIETRAYYDSRPIKTVDTVAWPVKNDASSYGRPPLAPIPPRSFEVQPPVSHIGDLQGMVNAPVLVTPKRTLVDRVLGRQPLPYAAAAVPRKVKGSVVINNVLGNQTNSTAAKNATAGAAATGGGKAAGPVAGTGGVAFDKAKAPVATGTGDATDQTGTGAASTVKGNGNAPVLTNTAPAPPGMGAAIAKYLSQPVGIVVALAAAGGLVWLALWWRSRNKVTDTLS